MDSKLAIVKTVADFLLGNLLHERIGKRIVLYSFIASTDTQAVVKKM